MRADHQVRQPLPDGKVVRLFCDVGEAVLLVYDERSGELRHHHVGERAQDPVVVVGVDVLGVAGEVDAMG
jgi:hypothetical protein